jgi:hypothetical protein
MLDINEGRQVFADYLQANWHKSKSLDAALMAAIEFAYRRGLEDGAATCKSPQTEPTA